MIFEFIALFVFALLVVFVAQQRRKITALRRELELLQTVIAGAAEALRGDLRYANEIERIKGETDKLLSLAECLTAKY